MPAEKHIRGEEDPKCAFQRGEAEIARVAGRQHGVITAAQLRELGVSMDAAKYRLRTGRLHRIHAGVYAVGHRALTDQGRWMAAVLAGGDDAVLSHRFAAAHWGFRETIASRIDVTVPTRRGHRPGIVFHQSLLHPADRTTHDGIPLTAVPRTLLDLAATLTPTQQDHAFWEAERLGHLDRTSSEPSSPAATAGAAWRGCECSPTVCCRPK